MSVRGVLYEDFLSSKAGAQCSRNGPAAQHRSLLFIKKFGNLKQIKKFYSTTLQLDFKAVAFSVGAPTCNQPGCRNHPHREELLRRRYQDHGWQIPSRGCTCIFRCTSSARLESMRCEMSRLLLLRKERIMRLVALTGESKQQVDLQVG